MQNAKVNYEHNLVQDFAFRKNYKIYEYINSLKKEDLLPSSMFNDTSEATSDQDKASLFNEYFYSVFTPSSFDTPLMRDISAPATTITNVISDTDVYSVLASLDPSKSPGIDGIGPKVLKHSALALYIPFHHLFSLCMTQCSIPSE